MILAISPHGHQLDEPDRFDAFALMLKDGATADDLPAAIEREGEDHAWVPADWVRELAGSEQAPDWPARFDAMIEKARPHGWIRDAPLRIKAHIVSASP